MMDTNIKEVLAGLMAVAEILRQCREELLKIGFSDEEAEEILQFYVYDKEAK